MKLLLLSTVAAVCATTGQKLDRSSGEKDVEYRYFSVAGSVPASTSALSDVQVGYIGDINPGDVCSGSGKLCIVSFNTFCLTAGKQHLSPGLQPIAEVISTKN